MNITEVNDDGAYVELLEYNNQKALILATQTTRKRVRNIRRLLRLNTQDVMQVITVDREGGFIDLSKKTLQKDDVVEKKQEYEK